MKKLLPTLKIKRLGKLVALSFLLFGFGRANAQIEVNGLLFDVFEDQALVYRYIGEATEVVIPDYIHYRGMTFPVTTIYPEAFGGMEEITSVVLSKNLTTIEQGAFIGCISLQNIVIPESVTTIGKYAFAQCYSLSTIDIKGKVSVIPEMAFEGCRSLTSLTLPETVTEISDGAFYGSDFLFTVTCPAPQPPVVYENSFRLNSATTLLVDPNSLEAYKSAEGWNTFPQILAIGDPAYTNPFYGQSFDDGQFVYLITEDGTAQLVQPINREEISGDIVLPSYVKFEYFSLPVTSIRETAFPQCKNITSVVLPSNLQTIGEVAFAECISLSSVTFPESLVTIGRGAFLQCEKLESLDFPGSLETIGEEAFAGTAVTKLSLPSTIMEIDNAAFYCPLEFVYCYATVPPVIYENSFAGSFYLFVEESAIESYKNAEYWPDNVYPLKEVEPQFVGILNAPQEELKIGETYQLEVVVEPQELVFNPTVYWESLNSGVATVDQTGLVTAVGEGTTDIIVYVEGYPYLLNGCGIKVSGEAGVESIGADAEGAYKVYNLTGVKVLVTKDKSELSALPSGIYIVNGKKVIL